MKDGQTEGSGLSEGPSA